MIHLVHQEGSSDHRGIQLVNFAWCLLIVMHVWFICTDLFGLTFSSGNIAHNLLVYCNRLWSRVVMTRTSQDRNRPSSRLDSEGEEEDDDTDKVFSLK